MAGRDQEGRYWVALAVDNSVPRPEPDPEAGFLPMYFNASPFILTTDEGDDALCVFSTEGKVIGYLREMEKVPHIVPAKAISLSNREAFRRFLMRYPTLYYVVLDPQPHEPVERAISVEDFLAEHMD